MLTRLLEILADTSIPQELAIIKEAYEKEDWETIARSAHTLKGSSLYCGTTRMKFAGEYLERYIKSDHRKLLKKLYLQMITTIDTTQKFLKNWLEKNR